ncbi:hypothetical protein ACNO5E_13460 [Vibrio parahaemolyticus]
MGIGAYNRGSKLLSDRIAAPFIERREREDRARACERSAELEKYCLDVQIALVEAGGLAGCAIRRAYAKKSKRLEKLQNALVKAHCEWLDSSPLYPLTHLSFCVKKADAAYKLLDYCCDGFKHPVPAPKGIPS